MTYCIGWKYNDSVFLLADTAGTSTVRPSTSHSSFGEATTKTKEGYVSEAMLKLVPLSKDTAVAFSGDPALANDMIGFLKDNLSSADGFDDLFSKMVKSYGPFPRDDTTALLLAHSGANGKPTLLRFTTADGLEKPGSDFYEIGSLKRSDHSELTLAFKDVLIAGQTAVEHNLLRIAALVQSYGVHTLMMERGVGGTIVGLQITGGDIEWMKDTIYVLTDPDFEHVELLHTFVRDNVLVVASSLTKEMRNFINLHSVEDEELWKEQWEMTNEAHIETGKFPYITFINTRQPAVAVMYRPDFGTPSNYFEFSWINDQIALTATEKLKAKLSMPLQDAEEGVMPMRFEFFIDR